MIQKKPEWRWSSVFIDYVFFIASAGGGFGLVCSDYSEEPRVCMFDHTMFTAFLYSSIAVYRDMALLDV